MKITVNRFASDDDATLSAIMVDGVLRQWGIEDEYRAYKISGETRIPAGIYDIKLRTVGGFHSRYGKKFPEFHRGMLQVMNVPGFEYILIHIGNTDDDTNGCLCVGLYPLKGRLGVGSSKVGYTLLYKMVIDAAMAGDLTIEYIDSDRGI